MRTHAICPISNKRINESVARSNAFFTVLLLSIYVTTPNVFIAAFLFVDFLLRALQLPQYSPLAIASRKLVQILNIKPKLLNAGPKTFAAGVGAIFSAAIILTALFGLNTLSVGLAVVFGICAFLEAAFAFCIACQVYPFVYKYFAL